MIEHAFALPVECIRLLAYWDAKRGAKPLPSRTDLDPLIDLPDLAPWMALVEPVGRRLRYRVLGGALEEMVGPRTGAYLDEVRVPPYLDYLTAMYALCQNGAAPVYCENGYFYGGESRGRSVRLALPLSADGARVDMFFGIQLNFALDGGALPPAWYREPVFREEMFGALYQREPDGAWRGRNWRTLA